MNNRTAYTPLPPLPAPIHTRRCVDGTCMREVATLQLVKYDASQSAGLAAIVAACHRQCGTGRKA